MTTPADQVYAPDLLWEYHKCQPLNSIKGKQNPLAKTALHTISSFKVSTIASEWPSLPLCSQSNSLVTLNLSQLSSLTSLLTPPHALTPYPQTRLPSLGPSMTSRPTPSRMDPSPHTLSRTSLWDMRIWHLPNYKHLLQASPPPYSRERRSITVRPTTSGSTSLMSMPSLKLSNNVLRILMESHCCALMDLRTIMEDSPHLLSLVQMGTVLLSSSSNWMMDKWQDLALWQEVSMMLISLTSLLHWPLITNLSNPSPLGSMPASGVTTLTTTPFLRLSSPLMTGAFSLRSSNTESWTERLLCYRQSLAWWI